MPNIKIVLYDDTFHVFLHTGKHEGKTNRIEYEQGYLVVIDEKDEEHKFLISEIKEVVSIPHKQ